MQTWKRNIHLFPDIRRAEDAYSPLIYVVEQQVGFLVNRNDKYLDEHVSWALALCGLRCAEQVRDEITFDFEGIDEMIVSMAERCLAKFHPDYNPEIQEVTSEMWLSSDARVDHFTKYGAAIRRLMYTVQFWGKASGTPRGYVRHVLKFLSEAGHDLTEDKIHYRVAVSPDAIDSERITNWT